jgi:Integrase core domain
VDDHSRLAYAEVLPDERAATCAGFLARAVAWLASHGVVVRRVLTDNAKGYRVGAAWIAACAELAIGRRFIQPGRPWRNGKAERFNRTLQTEWAYARPWTSNTDRTAALDDWGAPPRQQVLARQTQHSGHSWAPSSGQVQSAGSSSSTGARHRALPVMSPFPLTACNRPVGMSTHSSSHGRGVTASAPTIHGSCSRSAPPDLMAGRQYRRCGAGSGRAARRHVERN